MLVILIFRTTLSKILLKVSGLKYKDFELNFKKGLSEIEATATQIDSGRLFDDSEKAKKKGDVSSPDLWEQVDAVAQVSPLAAVPLAWSAIEAELLSAVMRLNIYPPASSAIQNIHYLRQANYLGTEMVAMMEKMYQLRNDSAHYKPPFPHISIDEALTYSRVAQVIVTELKGLTRRKSAN